MTNFLARCADYQLLLCNDATDGPLLRALNLTHLLGNQSGGGHHDQAASGANDDDVYMNARMDAATARNLKIARFKRERQLKETIAVIRKGERGISSTPNLKFHLCWFI